MRSRTGIGVAAALAATAVVAAPATAPAWAAGTGAAGRVTVHIGRSLGTIAPGALGADTPIWNPYLTGPAVPGLVRRAGIDLLEFNGGGVSDLYHWRDGSVSRDPDAANHPYDYASLPPQFRFDQFERTAHAAGAQTMVHVNYGTGTPQEAAGWVRYANRVRHDAVRDWAVGEEVWGNGSIPGVNFEPDAHPDRSPAAYARNVVAFARAMKAADPTIRVGVEVTGVASAPWQQWDRAVLAIAGPVVDFVDFHRYPFTADRSDAALLRVPRQIPADLAALRALVDRYAGRGHHVDLVAGETNSAVFQAPQQISPFNALYLADNALTLLENGTRTVAWWALHNGGYGETRGDLGLLSSGECNTAGTVCAPPVDTPYPPYFGQQIVGALARTGGHPVAASSTDPLVVAHAVRRPDGTLAVLLINEDPAQPHRVDLALPGYRAGAGVTVLRYAAGDHGVSTTHGTGTGARTLPPYSLTALILHPKR